MLHIADAPLSIAALLFRRSSLDLRDCVLYKDVLWAYLDDVFEVVGMPIIDSPRSSSESAARPLVLAVPKPDPQLSAGTKRVVFQAEFS